MKTYCRLTYRVPFSETDAMGIVHHSNHARYLERGRVEFLRLVGPGYTEVVKRGFHFPLTEMKIAFKRPLDFDDVILIETEISELSRVRLNFSYRIFTGVELGPSSISSEPWPGNPAVTGETFHCCTNEEGKPVKIAEDIHKMLTGNRG
jgi:acyl-CoA thioester hydrolase